MVTGCAVPVPVEMGAAGTISLAVGRAEVDGAGSEVGSASMAAEVVTV